jgi:microcin C transport system ATP-binding protein
MDAAELRKLRGCDIGIVFQEPAASLNPLMRIEKQMAETLLLHQGKNCGNIRARIIEALQSVALRDAEKRLGAWPHELSGGEKQRVMIAMALLNIPKLLIADEPTTSLDVTIQAQILELLKDLQRKLALSVLFITHDLGIVRSIADRVVVMQNGNIVEENVTQTIFSAPANDYTKLLINSEMGLTKTNKLHSVADNAAVIVNNLKVYYPIKKGFLRRVKSYIKACDDISFTLSRGETLGIVGESGSGKSSLARALLRLEKSTGSIQIADSGGVLKEMQGLKEKELRPLRGLLQIIFQDPYGSLPPRMTVRNIVGEGLLLRKTYTKAEREERVRATLRDVGMGDERFLERYPNEFSGGQRQRIAIARALALEPAILILDEPTSSLDRTVQYQVIELLRKLQAERALTYIFISHDLKLIRALADKLLVMKDGKAVESGPAENIFSAPKMEYTKTLLRAALPIDAA